MPTPAEYRCRSPLAMGLTLGVAFVTALAACSSDAVESTGSGGGTVTSGQGASDSGNGGFAGVGGGSTGGSESCAGELITAEPAPVDMFITLDKSRSMSWQGGGGSVKWDAVEAALQAFFEAPSAAGLGVSLSFFPPTLPGAPVVCTGADCGTAGPCMLGYCDDGLSYCESQSDCAGSCISFGVCDGDPAGNVCENIGGSCPNNYPCVDFPRSCAGSTTCDVNDFVTPVASGMLPNASASLVAALAAETPNGVGTPMRVALEGTVATAKAAAEADPTRRKVVVLATDGEPAGCEPATVASVAQVASLAASNPPVVRTFVVGVFGPDDPNAPTKMNEIATAGGTGSAIIVDSSADVTTEFLAALQSIQKSLGCVFDVPQPTGEEAINFDEINIEHTPPGGAPVTIPKVTGPEACGSQGGWYYGPGEPPSTMILCDSTCADFEEGGSVQIEVGCKTVVF